MLLTVREAARRLKVSEGCIYSLIASRQLPHIRVGCGRGRIRIREDDLNGYLAERRVEKGDQTQRPPRLKLKHLRV